MYYSSNALVLPPYPLEDAAKEIFLFLWPKICRNWKTEQNPEEDPVTEWKNQLQE
jgi:hypothetical protein